MRISHTLSSLFVLMLLALLGTKEVLGETRYRIRSADNINSIVNRFYPNRTKTKAQIMIGLLIENPKAFKGGNVNFLLRGKHMRIPDEADLRDISNEEAKELLSQQAFFFREGVTGAEYLAPIKKSDYKKSGKVISKENTQIQAKQQQKISKLEQERQSLKKRLDELFEEKKLRDEKLAKLEKAIRASKEKQLDIQNNIPTDIIQVEKKNKTLEERNNLLKQKLQETQSQLAENTRSTIKLERQLDTLKYSKDEPKQGVVVAPAIEPSSQIKQETVSVSITPKLDYRALWDKYNWLLAIIFLPLFFWYLIKLKRKRDFERDDDYASKIAEAEANSFLQQGKHIQNGD